MMSARERAVRRNRCDFGRRSGVTLCDHERVSMSYVGKVFVRSVTTVDAELHADESAGESGVWWGVLSGPLGWAVRFDIDRQQEVRISVSDELVIETSDASAATAVVVGFEPVDDARPAQRVRVEGKGPAPFVTSGPPENDRDHVRANPSPLARLVACASLGGHGLRPPRSRSIRRGVQRAEEFTALSRSRVTEQQIRSDQSSDTVLIAGSAPLASPSGGSCARAESERRDIRGNQVMTPLLPFARKGLSMPRPVARLWFLGCRGLGYGTLVPSGPESGTVADSRLCSRASLLPN